jgi:phage terminase large subunit
MWNSFIIPSWASPFVDPSYVEEMKLQHGEDSDEFRIRVLGLPPRTDATQFIAPSLVTAAQSREIAMFNRWPLIIGADVGRGDRSVLVPRRGRKVSERIQILTGERTTDFSRKIVDEIKMYREEEGLHANVIVEELGMGVGVVETIEDMGFADNVWGVNTGHSATEGNTDLYSNLRCEMWGEMKTWLEGNVELPNNAELFDDLTVIKKKSSGNSKLRLETKDEMRRRGVRSPDVGDALALTFAVPFDLLPERRSAHDDAWRGRDQYAPSPAGLSWMSN